MYRWHAARGRAPSSRTVLRMVSASGPPCACNSDAVQLILLNSIAFYHSGKLDETGERKTRLRQLAGELCMKRPARHRSSPMELAERLNPLAQQHCDPFSKHGLWRCDCTESEQ